MSSRVRLQPISIRITVGLALCLASSFLGLDTELRRTALAQSPETWTEVLVLSEPHTYWSRPTVVADPWGQVHVFWSERDAGEYTGPEQDDAAGDTLMHMVRDGENWSEPLGVIAKDPYATHVKYPYATVDTDGEIYLIWSGGNGLHFSRAPALAAHNAANWQPVSIVSGGAEVDQSRLVVGSGDRLHIVYAELAGDLGGNVLYTWSEDQGFSWSRPWPISEVGPGGTRVSAAPQMVVDVRDCLHVVWTERSAPDWTGQRILYSRSGDRGEAWTIPELLAEVQPGERWTEAPSLATTPDGKLHLVWVCGANPHRCYRASDDGGRTWSPAERILGEFMSLAGWDAIAADYQGNLHFVAQLRQPAGIYYATKPVLRAWSQPYLIVDQPGFENGHFLQAALSEGNQLHAVWQKSAQEGDVVYVKLATSASPLSPLAAPTMSSSPITASGHDSPTPTPALTSGARGVDQTSMSPKVDEAESADQSILPVGSAIQVLLLAIAPAVLLVALVVGLTLRKT